MKLLFLVILNIGCWIAGIYLGIDICNESILESPVRHSEIRPVTIYPIFDENVIIDVLINDNDYPYVTTGHVFNVPPERSNEEYGYFILDSLSANDTVKFWSLFFDY